jgi:hypothetical protein
MKGGMLVNHGLRRGRVTLDYRSDPEDLTPVILPLVRRTSPRPLIVDKAQLEKMMIASRMRTLPTPSRVPRLSRLILENHVREHRRARALVWAGRVVLAGVLAFSTFLAVRPDARTSVRHAWTTHAAPLLHLK